MVKDFIVSILRSCILDCCSRVEVIVTRCSTIRRNVESRVAGLYAFIDNDAVYYVGQSTDILRRVGGEHCRARIGASVRSCKIPNVSP